jgi:uncharacterized protein YjbJ (UPF0337 family)
MAPSIHPVSADRPSKAAGTGGAARPLPEQVARRAIFQKIQEHEMDKDRIDGSANQAKGAVKEAAGKMTGDAKLKAEGATQKAAGKVQNAVGGAKDALRDAAKH